MNILGAAATRGMVSQGHLIMSCQQAMVFFLSKLIGVAMREDVIEVHFSNVQNILFSCLIARKNINIWKRFVAIMRT